MLAQPQVFSLLDRSKTLSWEKVSSICLRWEDILLNNSNVNIPSVTRLGPGTLVLPST